MTTRYFHPLDPAAPYEPDEPPQRRVGTCDHCGAGIHAWVIHVPDAVWPNPTIREVVEPCDCDDDELHDDRPGDL